ncbi:MAG: substrate-binding domain-containing protein [Opitutales bacterium]
MAQAFSLPALRRLSLVEQTADALRAALQQGTLADPLPGEHQLARQLGVSRPTLRTALASLVREGRVHRAPGRRTRLAQGRPRPRAAAPAVCVVSPAARLAVLPEEHPVLQQMQALFTAKGLRCDEVFDPKLAGPRPEARLDRLTAGRPGTCWLLLGSTAPIQHWFARQGLVTLVLGTCHAGVSLPAIDLDYRAVGWHAAGHLLKFGHRQLALLEPAHPLAGDLACREGFLAYCARSSPPPRVTLLRLPGETDGLRDALDRLMARRPRPTAIFCLWQPQSLTVLLQLLSRGWRVPQDVSLLARDLHPAMEQAWPDLAHYGRPVSVLAARAVRLTQGLLAGRKPAALFTSVAPEFMPGRTLGAPLGST